MNLLKSTRIKNKEAKFVNLLRNLQGNILKSHGRDNAACVFLNFSFGDLKKIKKIIRGLNITTADEQFKSREAYSVLMQSSVNDDKYKSELHLSLFLTAKGYEALEIPQDRWPDNQAFRAGMSQRELGDPSLMEWEELFHKKSQGKVLEVHAMILLAHDMQSELQIAITSLKKTLTPEVKILGIQCGSKLLNHHGQTIEHFGYVDGISQPLFLESDFERVNSSGQTTKISEEIWNAEASLELVLTPDLGTSEKDCFGSYLVYRKLEQDVKGFKDAEHLLAEQLGFGDETEELAGALIVGRFENGVPVLNRGLFTDPEEPSMANDFDYSLDPNGLRCPFHSHIRKTNPRGDTKRIFGRSEEEERNHRIVRRGITYDDIGRNGNLSFKPSGGVGLLFMCFQSNIENQFEHIQKKWANNRDFPQPFTGTDPVIGQSDNRNNNQGESIEQRWRNPSGEKYPISFQSFVSMMGGEYFFAPSLPFIKSL